MASLSASKQASATTRPHLPAGRISSLSSRNTRLLRDALPLVRILPGADDTLQHCVRTGVRRG
jgi:hypothetical protein